MLTKHYLIGRLPIKKSLPTQLQHTCLTHVPKLYMPKFSNFLINQRKKETVVSPKTMKPCKIYNCIEILCPFMTKRFPNSPSKLHIHQCFYDPLSQVYTRYEISLQFQNMPYICKCYNSISKHSNFDCTNSDNFARHVISHNRPTPRKLLHML